MKRNHGSSLPWRISTIITDKDLVLQVKIRALIDEISYDELLRRGILLYMASSPVKHADQLQILIPGEEGNG